MKNSMLFFSVLMFSDLVLAAPVISSSCPQAQKITEPRGAGAYFMSGDCSTAYVLPPELGKVSVVGATAMMDMNACGKIRKYNHALDKIDSQVAKLVATPNSADKVKELLDQRKQLADAYGPSLTSLARSEALDVNLAFRMTLNESVQKYRDQNGGAGVAFQPIGLKNVKLYATSNKPFSPDMPPVLNSEVAAEESGAIGAGGFNAKLRLSLAAACNLVDEFTGEIPSELEYDKVAGVLAISATYDYELQATYMLHASYNLGALARQIKSESTQGGFFSTAAMSGLINSESTSGWFNLSVSCDDSRVCEQVKLDQALQIKSDLMQQVLDNIAMFKIGAFQPGSAASPGESGAGKAAGALRKCPNQYCQAAAIVLDVANATFGGTNKTDSYISANDSSQKMDISNAKPVTFTGNLGFEE